jgi:hypothetical protein
MTLHLARQKRSSRTCEHDRCEGEPNIRNIRETMWRTVEDSEVN